MLLATEVEELHGLFEELFSLSRINTSICWQRSRLQWLREGDANSKYFHGIIFGRRKSNDISSILVGVRRWRVWIMCVMMYFITFHITLKLEVM